MTEKTSQNSPLDVGWLNIQTPGKIGLTMAPGRQQRGAFTGTNWCRDLDADLSHLVKTHHANVIVCMLEDHELAAFGIADYEAALRQYGLTLHRLPIVDGGLPSSLAPVLELLSAIHQHAQAGRNVVIHCAGGLGRAGTIGGCYLRWRGREVDDVFSTLKRARGPRCPENQRQRAFIADFPPAADDSTAPAGQQARIAGAVLGAAIGDAMGHPTEFMSMDQIRARYGAQGVTTFELWWDRDGARFAPYTDDTQMAEIVLRCLIEGRANDDDLDATMTRMAAGFVDWMNHPQGGHRGPGRACLAGCRALARGVHWQEAGGETAGGCGTVMRAWPFGLVFADDLSRAELWAVEHSKLTHRDPIALAASAAIAVGTRGSLLGHAVAQVIGDMIAAAGRWSPRTAEMMQRAWDEARDGTTPDVTLDRLRSWAAHEAIAAAVYIFARHPDDARAAILEGANTPGDSDSIATLAGALVGARVGIAGLPEEWVAGVERSQALLELARQVSPA